MKKIFVLITGLILFLTMVAGCGNQQSVQKNELEKGDYTDFSEGFKETYTKYRYETSYIDAEKMAEFFIEDLKTYEKNVEMMENDGFIQKSLKNRGRTYRWAQHPDGGVDLVIYGKMSDEEFRKGKEQIRNYIESLDIELEIVSAKENDRVSEYTYRQMIDGVPISRIQGNGPTFFETSVGTSDGINLVLWGPVGSVVAVESYTTEDFLEIAVIKEIICHYREKEAEVEGREDACVEITINNIEIVYYETLENGIWVLEPMYEIDVEEYENGTLYEATYIMDVFTGYIEYREGDPYWL